MKKIIVLMLIVLSAAASAQQVRQGKFNPAGKSIQGVWIDKGNGSLVGDLKYAIYTENGKLYMAIVASEVYTVLPLLVKEVDKKTRYYDTRPGSTDYYSIGPEGLRVYDSQGYITTFENGVLSGSFNVKEKKTIGVWRDPNYAASEGEVKAVIYVEMEKYYMVVIFKDGFDRYPLEVKTVNGETRYYDTLSSTGDYFVIGTDGLKVYDSLGYIDTYKKASL